MLTKKETSTIGGLLHDIGKVVYRAGEYTGSHSSSGCKWLSQIEPFASEGEILDCLRFHHGAALRNASIPQDSCAYAVYIGDNIAAAADRRKSAEEEGGEQASAAPFRRDTPLASVFNLMHDSGLKLHYTPLALADKANYPTGGSISADDGGYRQKLAELKNELSKIEAAPSYINSLLGQLENILAFAPSSTCADEVADISLYDHCKITAATASAITAYLEDAERMNFKAELFDNERSFMDENCFLIFSCDFSGIQRFIYTIASEKALKSLRSRSFLLELLMEYLMDEILELTGLSRANLLYTGGGHSYMLLPNTQLARDALELFEREANRWLSDQFDCSLYLACAWTESSPNALINRPATESPYAGIYKKLSRDIAAKKLHRYDADELRRLNGDSHCDGRRECKICGVSKRLLPESNICAWCSSFGEISNELMKKDIFFLVSENTPASGKFLNMPDIYSSPERYIEITSLSEARKRLGDGTGIRVYSKNSPHTGCAYSTNLYMCDYVYDRLFEQLAAESKGIERIAVLRADVDSLGAAFTSGFIRKEASLAIEERERYNTISRTASFSRQMSLFFKYHLNALLNGEDTKIPHTSLTDDGGAERKAVAVYSGGDDLFIAGAWDSVLECAVDIRESFKKFTGGTLTLSAGIGIFPAKYPIYRSAQVTAELEERSKKAPGKDAVTLFSASGEYTYKWDDFISRVLPKVRMIGAFLDDGESGRGGSFLYKILECLRGADRSINIARCAYMLARLEPDKNAPQKTKKAYLEFSKGVYSCITDNKTRGELITAIEIYVYIRRGEAR